MPKIDLNDPEMKADLEARIAAEVEGLKNKNSELLGKNKKLKEELDAATGSVEEMKEELEELRRSGGNETVEAAVAKAIRDKEREITKLKKDLEEKDNVLKGKDSMLRTTLVTNGLNEALTKSGVQGPYLEAARALIQQGQKIEIEEGDAGPVVKVGDKALGDFVSEWVQGEHGKHFVVAGDNGGGGSQGGGSGGRGSAGKKRSEMTREEKAAYIDEHGLSEFQKLPA